MTDGQTPKWLRFLERHMRWLALPNIAVLLITLQVLGFLFITAEPAWMERLALIPSAVLQGEPWRLVTFLALPITLSPIWLIFVLWFLYFIVNGIESHWGSFKTTLYILISVFVTIGFSLIFGYPVTEVSNFESTLFLAAAALFPELEVRLFFAIPVKIKWLAWLTAAFVLLRFIQGEWMDRFYLLAIYSNYLLFFGPAHYQQGKQLIRRYRYRRKLK